MLHCSVKLVTSCDGEKCESKNLSNSKLSYEVDFGDSRVLNSKSETFGKIAQRTWSAPSLDTPLEKVLATSHSIGKFSELRKNEIALWTIYYKGIHKKLDRHFFAAHKQTHEVGMSFEFGMLCVALADR